MKTNVEKFAGGLAIEGGIALRTTEFPRWPQFDDAEKAALTGTLETGDWWRGSGSQTATFEAAFAEFHGASRALAVTNGTHALELAMMLSGVAPGDEVIVPAFTFISTAMAVQRVGARPVPVDVDLETYCLNSALVEGSLSASTRAIIPVSMAGHAYDVDALNAVNTSSNCTVIHDAAHFHGGEYRGRKAGEIAALSCFSFQNFKLMAAGEGGALLLPDEASWRRAFELHSCGRPYKDSQYRHTVVGSNFRLNEFSAAILQCQLGRLRAQNQRRTERARVLNASLQSLRGVIAQGHADYATLHPRYMYMLRLDRNVWPELERDQVVAALRAEGIPAFINYPAVYRTGAFQSSEPGTADEWAARCPNTETIAADGIWVHHRVLLGSEDDALDVSRALDKVLNGLGGS